MAYRNRDIRIAQLTDHLATGRVEILEFLQMASPLFEPDRVPVS